MCLYDKVFKKNSGCRALLGTKSSNSKSIVTHFRSKHSIDVDEQLKYDACKSQQVMTSYLRAKSFTEIWTLKSVVSKLVAVRFIKINL